jgi:hypothetical protein
VPASFAFNANSFRIKQYLHLETGLKEEELVGFRTCVGKELVNVQENTSETSVLYSQKTGMYAGEVNGT